MIEDFAYRGVHDLAVVGKAVTAAYYGSNAKVSYWNGCSTGGRQGMAEAQRNPSDFDGILAGAPAINWQKYGLWQHWLTVLDAQGDAHGQYLMTVLRVRRARLGVSAGRHAHRSFATLLAEVRRVCLLRAPRLLDEALDEVEEQATERATDDGRLVVQPLDDRLRGRPRPSATT